MEHITYNTRGVCSRRINVDVEDGKVVKVYCEAIDGTKSGEDTGAVKAKGVIQWVDAKNCVDLTARLYDYLLLPEDGIHTDFSERMNHESLITCNAKGEAYLSTAKPLQSFQFMRVGYFCKDSKSEGNVFNRVVGLKDGYKK